MCYLWEEIFLHQSSFESKHVTTPVVTVTQGDPVWHSDQVTQGTNKYQLFKDMDIIFPMIALTFQEFGYYSLSKLGTFKTVQIGQ